MEGERTADDVFGLLSNEIRVDILRAVARAQAEAGAVAGIVALSFSEIYDRVEVDNTAKLSYHLGELVGTFLKKHEEGYSFTHAGDQLVRFILAENYGPARDFEAIETDGTCLFCESTSLEATRWEQYFVVQCTDCSEIVTGYILTPAQARSFAGEELLDAFKRKQAAEYGFAQRGMCPACTGALDVDILDPSELDSPADVPFSYVVIRRCQECARGYSGPLCYSVAYRTPAIAFLWDHGIDILDRGMWELHQYLVDGQWTTERVAESPPRYEVVLRQANEELRVEVDEDARIVRTERARGQRLE